VSLLPPPVHSGSQQKTILTRATERERKQQAQVDGHSLTQGFTEAVYKSHISLEVRLLLCGAFLS